MIERDRDTNADGATDQRQYVLQDANFDVTAITDDSGAVLERFLHDAYGARTVLDSSWTTISDSYNFQQGHQGGKIDAVTGPIHFRHHELNTAQMRSEKCSSLWRPKVVCVRTSVRCWTADYTRSVTSSAPSPRTWRSIAGGVSSNSTTAALVAPYWLKLVRSGNSFSAYRSADGINWTQQGATRTITMGSTVYVGLSVTAHDNTKLNTAVFDNVTIAQNTVSLAATDATAGEGVAGDTGTFTITRTGSTTNALTVNYTVAGTATGGADYSALSGSVAIPAGATSADITVIPINDTAPEPDETLILKLAAGGYQLDMVENFEDGDISNWTAQAHSSVAIDDTQVDAGLHAMRWTYNHTESPKEQFNNKITLTFAAPQDWSNAI